MYPSNMSKTPHLDELTDIVGRLHSLLKDPEPGFFTWRDAMDHQLKRILPYALSPSDGPTTS